MLAACSAAAFSSATPCFFNAVSERLDDELGAFAAETRVRQVVLGVFADGTFEGLAGEAGAVDAAEDGGLGRADVVAVEAGDGEGLEDVEFDQSHVVS